MENPLVSIIVPAYNAEKFIDKCIRSVLNQNYINLELILIDDGSTDATGDICKKYAKEDARVRVICTENGGVSEARNTGLVNAEGEYVVFLDADDWLDEDIIRQAVKKYKKDCVNMWGVVSYWPQNVQTTEDLRVPDLKREELIANAICQNGNQTYNLGKFFRASCGKIYDHRIIEENHLMFPKGLFIGEDAVFLVRYLVHISGVNLISQKGYNYNHLNENSATTKYQKNLYEQSEHQYKELLNAVKEIEIEKNNSIRDAFVNFRWWMVASLSMNNLIGFLRGKVFVTELTKPAMRWIQNHREEMKESASNLEAVCPSYRNIYRYRRNLNKQVLYAYYFVPKLKKYIREHILQKYHKRNTVCSRPAEK